MPRLLLRLTLLTALAAALALGLAWLFPSGALRTVFTLQRIAAGASADSMQVAEHEWAVLEAGDGPTMVLVHGFTGSKENWLPLLALLKDDYRVIAPDLPGWGSSERLDHADYGYAAQADRLGEWLRALDDDLKPVVLVGHSMGGGIAAVTAARHPHNIDRLVLVDAGGVRFRDNEFGLAVLRGEHPFAVDDRESLDRYLGLVFKNPPFLPWPLDRALIARRIADHDFERRVLADIGAGQDAFLPGRLAERIAVPTLLVWCRDDAVIDASAGELYQARLLDSRLAKIEGCNHMPMMEQPVVLAALLQGFIGDATR